MLETQPIPSEPSPTELEVAPLMLDVHPPHQAIHGWRDFFIHLGTITIGFLIALTLEAGVEALHHHRLVREAREQIREEIQANQKLSAIDRQMLDASARRLRQDLVVLNQLKNHSGPLKLSDFDLQHWGWNSLDAASWQTARDSGALALMPYDGAHFLSGLYGQQALVNDQAILYIKQFQTAAIPLDVNPDIKSLSAAQIDELAHGIATTVADIEFIEALMNGLDRDYSAALR